MAHDNDDISVSKDLCDIVREGMPPHGYLKQNPCAKA